MSEPADWYYMHDHGDGNGEHSHHRNNGGHGSHEGFPLGTRREADPGFVDYSETPAKFTWNGEPCSYLGRFKDEGWSIAILPPLTEEGWLQYSLRAGEAWHDKSQSWSARKADEILRELFPDCTLHYLEPPREEANIKEKSE